MSLDEKAIRAIIRDEMANRNPTTAASRTDERTERLIRKLEDLEATGRDQSMRENSRAVMSSSLVSGDCFSTSRTRASSLEWM